MILNEHLLMFAGLDLMCVDPAWQRKGFGIILLKWGLDKADKLGIEVCLLPLELFTIKARI